jgi:hypothetical protein
LVELTRKDAQVLTAIPGKFLWSRGISLEHFINNFDFENREMPTFDEASYGLARLMANGLITATHSPTRGIRLLATRKGVDLQKAAERFRRQTSRHRWARIGERPAALAHLVGAPEWPEAEVEDRSVGRMPRLDEKTWAQAVNENSRAMRAVFEKDLRGESSIADRIVYALARGVFELGGLMNRRKRE